MSDILIRKAGRAGRITLNRPSALNALTHDMLLAIETALESWRHDPEIALVVVDATGEKAFCAGGDIAEMYRTASAGDFGYGRRFWADEYRINAKIAEYPKPYVALMQGYTMGGGVGVSCHGSHRIVCEDSKIAMPECGIGLVPDVGGSYLLSRAPGRVGDYLGTTATRMAAGDAIYAGFADIYLPKIKWPELVSALEATGDAAILGTLSEAAPEAPLSARRAVIDRLFSSGTLAGLLDALDADDSAFAAATRSALACVSPLAAATTLALLDEVRGVSTLREALALEYRATWRAAEDGDFIEGIRAAIIDRDNAPVWRHQDIRSVPSGAVAAMLAPIPGRIDFEGGMA